MACLAAEPAARPENMERFLGAISKLGR
jgi:hypothetical protein